MLYQLSYAGPVVLLERDHTSKRRVAEVGNRGILGRAPPRNFIEGDSGRYCDIKRFKIRLCWQVGAGVAPLCSQSAEPRTFGS